MLDNLRESASQSPFFQDEPSPPEDDKSRSGKQPSPKNFLGMTPVQRFILALMLFMMVCIFGALVLMLAEKVWI